MEVMLARKIDHLMSLIQQLDVSDSNAIDHVCLCLESLYDVVIEAELSGYCYHPHVIQKVFGCWKLFQDEEEYTIPGRPTFDIPIGLVECLMDLQFTSIDISKILGVSRRTVCRRMRQYGLSYTDNCCISDINLDEIVKCISAEHPGCGSKMMSGHLRAQGITVQQIRVRESLRRVDPEGTLARLRTSVRRRVYDVPAPQCLWHIDGNHKLVRWRFIIHSGIDGFSRLPVYLKCSTTNTSEEVLSYFLEAVGKYGCPLRVRSDMGGENIRVAEYMWSLQHMGVGQGMVMGRSVHNQRIERLWRDVYQGCLCLFYNIFAHLERCGYLNPCNEVHLFILHFIYKPRIQQSLENFQQAYANHLLSSCGNHTPMQQYISGAIVQVQNQQQSSLPFCEGIDFSAPLPSSLDDDTVIVPPVTVPSAHMCAEQLRRYNVDPVSDDSNFGINLYKQALDILQA